MRYMNIHFQNKQLILHGSTNWPPLRVGPCGEYDVFKKQYLNITKKGGIYIDSIGGLPCPLAIWSSLSDGSLVKFD